MAKFESTLTAAIDQEIEKLRTGRRLTRVTDELEGVSLAGLPDNVYGYTLSPVNESTPLFSKRVFQSFEIHKLNEGAVHILGFVTSVEASQIQAGATDIDIKLFPEPRDASNVFVEVPLDRVSRCKAPSRSDGNFMLIHLA